MAKAATSVIVMLFTSLLALSGCVGGSPAPAKTSAESTDTVAKKEPPAPKKTGPDCSDGTCIVCGDAQCPKGFFCDESSAKPVCQWVPTCAESVTCACVERALTGGKCTCTERDGGSYVRCEG